MAEEYRELPFAWLGSAWDDLETQDIVDLLCVIAFAVQNGYKVPDGLKEKLDRIWREESGES